MLDPGFPVFDADNHLYESPEMLTEYLPKEYARDIQFVQVRGRARIAVKGKITDYMPNPTFEKVAPPGAHVDFYRGTNTEGKTLREMSGQAIDCIPAFRDPAPRLEAIPTSPTLPYTRSIGGCTTCGASTTRIASSRRP